MSWLLPSFTQIKAIVFPRKPAVEKRKSSHETNVRAVKDIRFIQKKVISGRVEKQVKPKEVGDLLRKPKGHKTTSRQSTAESTPATSVQNDAHNDSASSVDSPSHAEALAEQVDKKKLQMQLLHQESSRSLEAQSVEGWSVDEIWLFEKLNRRGLEPLMPELWQWDFPSYPDNLFTTQNDRAHIKNLTTPVTEAVDEFQYLVDSGPRCRDNLAQDNAPEPPLARAIHRYKNWSLRDGRLYDREYLDLTTVVQARPSESVGSVIKRANRKLKALGQRWRQLFRESEALKADDPNGQLRTIPTLFAFVVKYSVVSIVSYDPNLTKSPTRTLESLNHQIELRDVWHALAISITCIHARNHLLRLEQKGLFNLLYESVEEVDA